MFEELAAQGRSMLKRLEAERAVAPSERESLPPRERVPMQEAVDWEQRVRTRVGEECGEDTQARLGVIHEVHRAALRADESDGYTPTITAYHRIVDLLVELDAG